MVMTCITCSLFLQILTCAYYTRHMKISIQLNPGSRPRWSEPRKGNNSSYHSQQLKVFTYSSAYALSLEQSCLVHNRCQFSLLYAPNECTAAPDRAGRGGNCPNALPFGFFFPATSGHTTLLNNNVISS